MMAVLGDLAQLAIVWRPGGLVLRELSGRIIHHDPVRRIGVIILTKAAGDHE
jgi:hypothetical protein